MVKKERFDASKPPITHGAVWPQLFARQRITAVIRDSQFIYYWIKPWYHCEGKYLESHN